MIGIIDYGVGNLFSVQNSLDYLGVETALVDTPAGLEAADGLLLPGVGAFPDAMAMLQKSGLVGSLKAQAEKKPLLGICLGMQLLFDTGYEFAETPGLGLIPGTVRLLEAPGLKIPHMGWNSLELTNPCPLTQGLKEGDYVYFVHSYAACTHPRYICAQTTYGQTVPALVRRDNVYGAQFHPEKSSAVGLTILENFAKLVNG